MTRVQLEESPVRPAIQVRGLNKAFGRTAVLRGLDLEVPRGEFLTIFGPNGAGKTTLIRVLATLTRPDSGRVHIEGLRLGADNQRIRRLIGVVMHNTLLYEGLTGYENLAFYARMFGLDAIEERVCHVADQMGIDSRLQERVRTLSHGMQKRFSIARALLHDPLVLLLDEPESGLDQAALEMLERAISRPDGRPRTVVMTTHNVERGLSLSHRVAILVNGKITCLEPRETVDVASFRSAYFRSTGATL